MPGATRVKRAIILIHTPLEGPSLLAPALERHGFSLSERFRTLEPSDVLADLVVVMGGPMGVYEEDAHPFLAAERELIRERLRTGMPVLGVCLGAQLLAAAAGARVFPGAHGMELGIAPIRITPSGAEDPIFAGLSSLEVAHWHGDTFDPVPGARILASTERYSQQAFRLGSSYGLQFHLELTPEEFLAWLEANPDEVAKAGKTIASIQQDELPHLRKGQPALVQVMDRLAAHFAQVCNRGGIGA